MTASDAGRLGVAEATAVILAGVEPLGAEEVPLGQARARVVARDVRAPRDLPPWPNASMDGYAVRSVDIAQVPARLRVVETIHAGALPSRTIGEGEAARIMTGAPIPAGADSVVRIEDTDRGVPEVEVRDRRDAGLNVRHRGEDVVQDAVAVARGSTIDAATLGMLAAVGAREVAVYRRPRVAILSAGDELVPLAEHDRAVAEQKVVDVNVHTLRALAEECGATVQVLDLAPDDPAILRERLAQGRDADVLVTSGSVSVGDRDHLRDVLRSLGAEILVHRLRIRPGAPLAFGRLGACRWIGLPGNPVSAMVTFELFVRPLLRLLQGDPRPFRATVPARTTGPIRTAAALTHFLRVTLTPTPHGVFDARLTGPQGSGLVSSMARADALLVVPETMRDVAPGTMLRALLLHDRALTSEEQVA